MTTQRLNSRPPPASDMHVRLQSMAYHPGPAPTQGWCGGKVPCLGFLGGWLVGVGWSWLVRVGWLELVCWVLDEIDSNPS